MPLLTEMFLWRESEFFRDMPKSKSDETISCMSKLQDIIQQLALSSYLRRQDWKLIQLATFPHCLDGK